MMLKKVVVSVLILYAPYLASAQSEKKEAKSKEIQKNQGVVLDPENDLPLNIFEEQDLMQDDSEFSRSYRNLRKEFMDPNGYEAEEQALAARRAKLEKAQERQKWEEKQRLERQAQLKRKQRLAQEKKEARLRSKIRSHINRKYSDLEISDEEIRGFGLE